MRKLFKEIIGVPDGEVYPRKIPAGENCPENLIDYATTLGAFEPEGPQDALKGKARK